MHTTENLRIKHLRALTKPKVLSQALRIDHDSAKLIEHTRQQARAIIHGQDDRLLVIVGPCSIHDPTAALDYAKQLKSEIKRFEDRLCIIMRVYFEKPRTTLGWKGLINDPTLDGRFNIKQGLHTARQLLIDINQLGVPTGSEFLDTIIPQYIADLTAWSAIGARTSESQLHRELASGLSMPLGFKNGTSGNVQIAIDGVLAAQQPHHFLGIDEQGQAAIVSTTGNHDCHIILRGSRLETNFDQKTIHAAVEKLTRLQLPPRIMVDCSHGNSGKDHRRQMAVIDAICQQLRQGNRHICGVMIESNLIDGKQTLDNPLKLTYGQSITDACIDFTQTIKALEKLADAIL